MQDHHQCSLVYTDEQISYCLSNLMLTGVATPYCHNGVAAANNEAHHDVSVSVVLYKTEVSYKNVL